MIRILGKRAQALWWHLPDCHLTPVYWLVIFPWVSDYHTLKHGHIQALRHARTLVAEVQTHITANPGKYTATEALDLARRVISDAIHSMKTKLP